jgi:hypothetical protein
MPEVKAAQTVIALEAATVDAETTRLDAVRADCSAELDGASSEYTVVYSGYSCKRRAGIFRKVVGASDLRFLLLCCTAVAVPALEGALEALDTITPSDLSLVKSMAQVSDWNWNMKQALAFVHACSFPYGCSPLQTCAWSCRPCAPYLAASLRSRRTLRQGRRPKTGGAQRRSC